MDTNIILKESVLDTIPLACYVLDNDQNFIYLNKKAENFLKRDAAKLIGKNVWKEFPEARNADYFLELNNVILNKKPNTLSYLSVYTKSWIKLTVTPIPEGVIITFNCIEQDKHNENLYKTLVENTPDVITKWDSSLKLTYGNLAFIKKLNFY